MTNNDEMSLVVLVLIATKHKKWFRRRMAHRKIGIIVAQLVAVAEWGRTYFDIILKFKGYILVGISVWKISKWVCVCVSSLRYLPNNYTF